MIKMKPRKKKIDWNTVCSVLFMFYDYFCANAWVIKKVYSMGWVYVSIEKYIFCVELKRKKYYCYYNNLL